MQQIHRTEAINASIDTDKRLWREDVEGSKAHAAMLAAQGIITAEDNAAIQAGLDQIAAEIVQGTFEFSVALEDIIRARNQRRGQFSNTLAKRGQEQTFVDHVSRSASSRQDR